MKETKSLPGMTSTITYKGKNYTGKDTEPKGNFGRGPTTAGVTGKSTGLSTAKAKEVTSHTSIKKPSNPDKIQTKQMPNRKGNGCH